MRIMKMWIGIGLIALISSGCAASQQAAQQADAKLRESTDMRLDDMTKSRDMAITSQIEQGIQGDPGLANIRDKVEVAVSHNVVVISGRVRTQKQKDRVEEIVKNAIANGGVKEYELLVKIDDTIEDLPFEWD